MSRATTTRSLTATSLLLVASMFAGAQTLLTNVTVGAYPRAVAVNPTTNKIYVANQNGNSVTVIDGATNNTTTVWTGGSPVALAVNSVTNKIYVADSSAASVTVIDGATNRTSNISTAYWPLGTGRQYGHRQNLRCQLQRRHGYGDRRSHE